MAHQQVLTKHRRQHLAVSPAITSPPRPPAPMLAPSMKSRTIGTASRFGDSSTWAENYGVYYILKSMEQGPSFRVTVPKYPTKDANYRILARQRSRFTHYYFYIRDEILGPMVMLVASFLPFQTTYYLNGHSFIEQELNRAGIGFRKNDNAFLAVDDPAALQAAADRLSPEIIRQRLDYWTLILGPKFFDKERTQLNLSRFYAIAQIEYCRNFIFKRHFPIHKLFERSCELGLWQLTGDKIATIFGTRMNRTACAASSPRSSTTSSTATMSSAPISSAPSSNNTKSSRPTCATSWSQTTSPIALLFFFFHKRLCGPLANSRFHHRRRLTRDLTKSGNARGYFRRLIGSDTGRR